MPATAGSTAIIGRDVVYRLRFEVDGSAKQAGEQAAKIAEESYGRAERSKKKETSTTKTALDEQIKHAEAYIKKVDETTKLYETAAAKRRAADMQLVASAKQAIAGVTQLGRSFVLLGVSSEKDLQKALQALAGFEAGANAIKGTINILEAASKAWGAYRTAVISAGAANAAYGALSAGGRAAAAGAAGAGVAGEVATGAAGNFLGGGAVGVAGTGAAVSAGKGIGAFIAAVVTSPAFIIAGIALGAKALQEAATSRDDSRGLGIQGQLVMKIPGYRNLAEALGPGLFGDGSELTASRRGDFIARSQFEMAQAQREAGVAAITGDFSRQRAEGQLTRAMQSGGSGTAGALAGVRGALGITGQAGFGDALGGGTALVDRQIALRERELDLVKQIGNEQKQAASEQIRALETELQKAERISEAMRGQLTGAAERFGQLTPAEQQRTIDAQRRLSQGQALSQDDRRRLRGLGLDSTTAGVRAQDIADAERAGFSKFFGADERAREQAANQDRNRIAIAIKTQRDFIVKVEADTEAEAEHLANEVGRLMVERDKQLEALFNEKVQKYIDQHTEARARDAQSAAALSGA